MADKKKVSVFQIKYDTNEFNFTVNIAAWSKEDAFGYLSKMLKKVPYKITEFTSVTYIDAITTQVTDDIIKANILDKTSSEKVEIKTSSKEDDTEKELDDIKSKQTKTSMKKK